jgi:predicted metal-dependent hydrolase
MNLSGLTFEIRRSTKRRTLGLTVDRGGELVIHAPATAAFAELEEWVRKKLLWVHRKLAIKEALAPKMRPPEYVTGETFHYLGHGYRLALVDEQEQLLSFDGHRFTLRRDGRSRADEQFRQWYIDSGSEWISRRVKLMTRRAAVGPSRLEVRDLGYRWGSCGKHGAIYLNWRLLQLPARLTDYVICHELIHIREHNHGPAFWSLLDSVQPDWRERKQELAERARIIRWFGMFECSQAGTDQAA